MVLKSGERKRRVWEVENESAGLGRGHGVNLMLKTV